MTWKILNEIINKQPARSKLPPTFTNNNKDISDPYTIANKFCEVFTNMGPDLAKKLPPSDISHSSFLKNKISETIFLKPVTEDEIKKLSSSFKAGTKHVDMMASRLLMLNPILISLPHLLPILLTYLFLLAQFQMI